MLNPYHEPNDKQAPVTTATPPTNDIPQDENRAIKHALGDPRLSAPQTVEPATPQVSSATVDYFVNPHPGQPRNVG